MNIDAKVINKIRNEKGNVTTEMQKYKGL